MRHNTVKRNMVANQTGLQPQLTLFSANYTQPSRVPSSGSFKGQRSPLCLRPRSVSAKPFSSRSALEVQKLDKSPTTSLPPLAALNRNMLWAELMRISSIYLGRCIRRCYCIQHKTLAGYDTPLVALLNVTSCLRPSSPLRSSQG